MVIRIKANQTTTRSPSHLQDLAIHQLPPALGASPDSVTERHGLTAPAWRAALTARHHGPRVFALQRGVPQHLETDQLSSNTGCSLDKPRAHG